MRLVTSLRTDALLLGADDRCLAAALLADAAFAAVLRVDGYDPGPVRLLLDHRAGDPALPGALAALAPAAAGIDAMTAADWIEPTLDVAPGAVAAELAARWGGNIAAPAIARHRARSSLEAACAGDGNLEADALALLLRECGWLDVVRGLPSTRSEDRRLAAARPELPAAPAAFVAACAELRTPLTWES